MSVWCSKRGGLCRAQGGVGGEEVSVVTEDDVIFILCYLSFCTSYCHRIAGFHWKLFSLEYYRVVGVARD